MLEKETRIPIQGLTLTEQIHCVDQERRALGYPISGAVDICETTEDLERRVISGEAATMGEALKQLIEELELDRTRRRSDEAPVWTDCGTLQESRDGTCSIVDSETARVEEPRERLDDFNQLKLW